jgi:hypothetical protein
LSPVISPIPIYPASTQNLLTHSHTNPHHTNNNIHPLALPALVLETPKPVPLVIPVRAAGAVHASPSNFTTLLHLSLLVLNGGSGVRQVLNNRAVDRELVPAVFFGIVGVGFGGSFGYEGCEDRVDDGIVPGRGAFVVVRSCGAEGGGAGGVGDLSEAGGC